MKYLYCSKEIKEQLSFLFSGKGEKWAIVGFVGYNALDHLPEGVSDLSVICWPKAGGTNPDGVRRLIDHNISVYFCDRLHQKIYWCKDVGLIVGSANLSDNALGEDGLHEFGVYCNDAKFDINKVIECLKYVEVTAEKLAELDVAHAVQSRRQQGNTQSSSPPCFLDAMRTKCPKRWKLVTYSEVRKDKDQIREEVEANFHTKNWVNDNDVEPNTFQVGDFVLQVKINDSDGMIKRANGAWLLVDHIVKQGRNCIVVQVNKLDSRTSPPFEIDSVFKKHFKAACNNSEEWSDVLNEDQTVKPSFIYRRKTPGYAGVTVEV